MLMKWLLGTKRAWLVGLAVLATHGWSQAQFPEPDDGIIPLLQEPIMPSAGPQGLTTPPRRKEESIQTAVVLKTPADTRELCDAAVSLMAQQEVGQAFSILSPYWAMPATEVRRLAGETQSQFRTLMSRFGNIVGVEWVRTRTAADSLVQHLYLLKLQHHGVRVVCTFYRPQEQWQVHTVSWDDDLEALLGP